MPYVQEKSFTVKSQTRTQFAHSSDGTSMVPSILRNRLARLHATEFTLVERTLETTPRGYVVSKRMVKEQITPQAVEQTFELDFSEREKGTAMSRDDIKFCETVESGIVHLKDLHYEMPLPFKHQNIQLPKQLRTSRKASDWPKEAFEG